MAAKVLKADSTAASDAYVSKTLGALSEVWVTLNVAFTSAALAHFLSSGYSGDFCDINETLFSLPHSIESVYIYDASFWSEDNSPFHDGVTAPVADTWQLVEMHFKSGVVHEVYVDGAQQWTDTAGTPASGITSVDVGQVAANTGSDSIAYVGYVKIGSTRGSGDIFQDDFSAGTLAAWDSTVGSVSVVDDPFGGDADFGPTEIPVTTISRDGVAPPAQVASNAANGMFFAANDARIYVEIESTDAGSQTVKFPIVVTVDGESGAKTVTVPAGAVRVAGIWPEDFYNQDDESVTVTPSVDGTLKFRAYQLPHDVVILDG